MSTAVLPQGYRFSDAVNNDVVTGSGCNWVSLAPRGALVYGARNQIDFEISSTNQFASLKTGYVKFDINFKKTTPNQAITSLTTAEAGLASCIDRLRTTLNNKQVEDLEGYGDDLAQTYSTVSDEKKMTLQALEAYGINALNSTNDTYTVIHYFNSDFHNSISAMPLPFCNVHVSLYTAGLQDFIYQTGTVTNNVTDYTISNISMNLLFQSPSPLYLASMYKSLEAGKLIKVNFQQKQRFRAAGNGSNSLQVQLSTGQRQSINNLAAVMHRVRTAGDSGWSASDKFRATHHNLKEWNIEPSNGTRIPLSRNFQTKEAFAAALSMFSDPLNPNMKIDWQKWLGGDGTSSQFKIAYSFKPSAGTDRKLFFGDGLENVRGWINLNLDFNEPFPTTSEVITWVDVDTQVLIGKGTVSVAYFF